MDTAFVLRFTAKDVKTIMDNLDLHNPAALDYILVTCNVQPQPTAGGQTMEIKGVIAEGFRKPDSNTGGISNGTTVKGCPVPPCLRT